MITISITRGIITIPNECSSITAIISITADIQHLFLAGASMSSMSHNIGYPF